MRFNSSLFTVLIESRELSRGWEGKKTGAADGVGWRELMVGRELAVGRGLVVLKTDLNAVL